MDEINLKTSFTVRMDYEDIVNMKKALAKRIRDMKSEDGALDQKTLEELKLKLTGSISWTR
jgi:hypothetical protein